MNILAVESSTQACSVALKVGDQCWLEYELAPQKHANLMLSMVEKVLADADMNSEDIDLLAYSEGPGAFTGIRIAAGVVQGLGLGWNKPIVAVSTLEALAWQGFKQNGKARWLACLDARMNEMYIQSCQIENGALSSQPAQLVSETIMLEALEQQQIENGIGDIAQEYPNAVVSFANWETAYPKADAIAALASQKHTEGKLVEDKVPLPVYLRNNVALKKGEQKNEQKKSAS